MSRINIRDYFIKMGFDAKDVDKGLGKLDQQIMKFGKKVEKQTKTIADASKREVVQQNKRVKGQKQENALLAQKAKAIKKVQEAQRTRTQFTRPDAQDFKLDQKRRQTSTTFGERRKNLDLELQGAPDLKVIQRELDNTRNKMRKLEVAAKKATSPNELRELRMQYQQLNGDANRLLRSQRRVTREMQKQKFVANSLRDSFRNLGRSYISAFAVIGGAGMAGAEGQNLVSLRATLLGVSGDAKQAAKDFDFVANTSKRLGVDLTEATSSFGKLGAATKAAGLSGDDAREMFLAVSELSTAFQLSGPDFEGVSRAMSQIMAK